jgi:hypothetical protein
MRFKIEEVTDEDFPTLIAAEWEAFENPFQSSIRLFCPVFNGDRAAGVSKSTEDQHAQYKAESESTWIKVVDTTDGDKIVGAALWKIYETNPFEKPNETEAIWYPEGIQRDFVTRALIQLFAPRVAMARRPHACKFLVVRLSSAAPPCAALRPHQGIPYMFV